MQIQLSDHFSYKKLMRFTLPSILSMLFTSIYGVVDGFFVSNVVGESAFASINLIMPYLYIFSALGSVLGVGGGALVALLKGQQDNEKANRVFSMLLYTTIATGLLITVFAELLLEKACRLLGASESMMSNCLTYGRIFLTTQAAGGEVTEDAEWNFVVTCSCGYCEHFKTFKDATNALLAHVSDSKAHSCSINVTMKQ